MARPEDNFNKSFKIRYTPKEKDVENKSKICTILSPFYRLYFNGLDNLTTAAKEINMTMPQIASTNLPMPVNIKVWYQSLLSMYISSMLLFNNMAMVTNSLMGS